MTAKDMTRRTAMKTLGAAGLLALGGGVAAGRKGASADPTLVDLAIAANSSGPFAGDFDVLIAALVANPSLLEALGTRAGGQYTVFAPTDDAFAAAGFTTANADAVPASVLAYHVTRGRRYAASVLGAPRLPTLNGDSLAQDGGVLNGGQATITATDFEASNGVLHVIDGVLLP